MSDKLVVSVSLLTGRFHGKGQGNAAEWPPAPFRLFQALVAGAAQTISVDAARSALLWLEIQATSSIRTPSAYKGNKINLYVLTNQRDKAIGTKKSEAELKTKKVIEPIILASDQDTELHYVFENAAPSEHLETLQAIALGISHFGHGVDAAHVVMANVPAEEVQKLKGEQWTRSATQGISLSVAYSGSLERLEQRYASWRQQATRAFKKLAPPIPIPRHAFQKFCHEENPELPCYRSFELRSTNGQRLALPHTSNVHLAGMVRHVTTDPKFADLLGWSADQMGMLHGHGEIKGQKTVIAEERFGFVGLPTIRWAGKKAGWQIDDCRRVILTAPSNFEHLLDDLAVRLNHRHLQPLDKSEPINLVSIPNDSTVSRYTQSATRWATVTPMVMPNQLGSSKDRRRLKDPKLAPETRLRIQARLDRRIDTMIRNSIVNAGFSRALANAAVIRWSRRGYWPGAARAFDHSVTKRQDDRPRRHVEISWFTPSGIPLAVGGPITLGAGAHAGLGLFAPHPDELNANSSTAKL
jgi:CRISPR-associated protein Csb2